MGSRSNAIFSPAADYWTRDIQSVDRPSPKVDEDRPFWRKEPSVLNEKGKVVKGGLFVKQKQWWDLPTFVRLLVGGYGCISGDTKIFNPLTREERTAKELSELGRPIHVLSLMPDGTNRIALASAPFVKGMANLYLVSLKDGRTITTTMEHRFFTRKGWRKLSELCVGDDLGCAANHPQSSLGDDRSVPFSDVGHCCQTVGGLRDRCSSYLYPDDGLLRFSGVDGLTSFPLPNDARGYNHLNWQKDDQGGKVERNHRDQLLCLHSKHDFLLRTAHPFLSGEFQASPFDDGSPLHCNRQESVKFRRLSSSFSRTSVDRMGQSEFFGHPPVEAGTLLKPPECYRYDNVPEVLQESSLFDTGDINVADQSLLYSFQDYNEWIQISKIEWIGREKFYDLTVPGPANYLAQGIWNHNSGKSYCLGKRLISLALQNSGCMIASVSPTFPLARKTMIPTLEALLAGKQTILGKSFWWRHNKSTHEFRIRYKGRNGWIQVMSGEDPDSLRGPNIAAAGLDEPFLMEVEVFRQMIARIRHPDAVIKELDLAGSPESLNWGYDLAMGEMKQEFEEAGTTVGMVQLSSRDNPAVGTDYIKRLEGAFTEKAAEAYIEGGFVNLSSGQVYYAFKSIGPDSNIRDLPIPDNAELGCGMDFNVNPMSAALFWRQGDHMHFFDEIELPNADTELLCDDLYRKYVGQERKTKQQLHYIYPDASGSARHTSAPAGKTDFHFIREAGFTIRAHAANPKQKDRYNAANGKFKAANGKSTLTVSPKCKKLIRYLLTYTHELKNKPEQKAMSHLLDCATYGIEFLYPCKPEIMIQTRLTGH